MNPIDYRLRKSSKRSHYWASCDVS